MAQQRAPCELCAHMAHTTDMCFVYRPDMALAYHRKQLPQNINPGTNEKTKDYFLNNVDYYQANGRICKLTL